MPDIPRDLDGDGQFEDVNGDETFDIADVQMLFVNRDKINENMTHAFDFNTDTKFNIADVQTLFQRVIS